MKYLVVNADDFGASRGINRGIIESHRHGIVTSTSLMVNMPHSADAASMAEAVSHLSVGLHIDLPKGFCTTPEDARQELENQFARFETLMNRPPTHLDSHHNIHRDPQLLPHFVALAAQHGLPLRDHSSVRHCSAFYGQWNGETHLEQISAGHFMYIVRAEVRNGATELSCHPGYVDPDYPSRYSVERWIELHTLCNPIIRRQLEEYSIELVNFHDLEPLPASLAM